MRAPFRLAPVLFAAALPLALSPAVPRDAAAQGMIRPDQSSTPRAPGPAPALPGLAARRAPAPIAAEPGQSLSPNAALFDAISRGDLAAARDAVARGANLEARNQLGLTPIDAAVDQGRNEIAFYLLSARDPSRVSSAPEPGSGGLAAPPATPAARSPAARGLAAREAPAPSPAARSAAATVAAASASAGTPATARLWAGDGGTPRPEIGFLGFDAGRPAGIEPPVAATPTRRGGRG